MSDVVLYWASVAKYDDKKFLYLNLNKIIYLKRTLKILFTRERIKEKNMK